MRGELEVARARIEDVELNNARLHEQLRELNKLAELQRADLERYKQAIASAEGHQPERVPEDQLQLAFERVMESITDKVQKADVLAAVANDEDADPSEKEKTEKKKMRDPHGRRPLEMTNLPVHEIWIDPDEVVATGGVGFERIGEEIAERVAFRPGRYERLRFIRGKWMRVLEPSNEAEKRIRELPVRIAPLPGGLMMPRMMADPSAIAHGIIAKYDDSLPLYRQQKISAREGFEVSRSTQCSWFGAAYSVCHGVVEAMFAEAKSSAFCIATDATGAPVRSTGECVSWHVFVFIADRDHIVFRYAEKHTSDTISDMLQGFRGFVQADAATIFNVLYVEGMIEVGCWIHFRRYAWKGLSSDPNRALEILSVISKLFEIARECAEIPMPERTEVRAARAKPILQLVDQWMDRNRDRVDPRSPLDSAITYYDNQRAALHRFLEDGRLRLDNNLSEQQLRNVILGCHNWTFFANETGLRWYTTFRSLIASCALHDLNPQVYLEQLLRLAPHWSKERMIELAPKYWRRTIENLSERQLEMIRPPWERTFAAVDATAPPRAAHDAA